jgi:CheY-like chemotaxis protein
MTQPHVLNVLIVDDHQDSAESLAYVVQTAGHRVQTAYGARDAAQRVQAGFRPDAIVMDIGLPDMDGFQVAKELCRGLGHKPLLIAVTGYSNLDGRTRKEGFEVYFVKPVDPELLLSILDGHAGRAKQDAGAKPTNGQQ